ncbi:hypothetical protein U9M48_022457 [Paspalum notatum var. saurae]|uniref:BHLH domain-containing protein n=1 Tax=Paspalum notatum var. saurae TaxID=547442 RepID=A0AAQ3THS3_PASNO
MHLHTGGAVHLHLQYFMPRHRQPPVHQQAATDLQALDSAVCRRSSATTTTSPAAATMWEYHQAAHAAAALQTSSSVSSFPSWSPYATAGTTAALLGAGSAFATDAASSPDMRLLPAAGEHVHGHAWSQQHDEQSNSTCYRENFLDLLASKNVTQEMFDDVPAGHYAAQALSGRFGAGSDVAPIKYEVTGSPLFFGNTTAGMHQGMSTPCYAYATDDHHQMKEAGSNQQQEQLAAPAMTSFLEQLSSNNPSVGMNASLDYSGIEGLDKICQESRSAAVEAASPFAMRSSLPDLSSFGGYRSTAESTTSSVQPYAARSSNLSDKNNIRQEQDIVSARSSSSGSGAASDRKKRPSEERTGGTRKKSTQDGSKSSPPKQQVPKVKIGEKITALQQIVSPFGKVCEYSHRGGQSVPNFALYKQIMHKKLRKVKRSIDPKSYEPRHIFQTDTASVLFETIKYIKFLHEQVQLLSEPYTNNSNRNKAAGSLPWGDLHRAQHAHASDQTSKGGGGGDEAEHDLRDRGLCLVPVSWTPEVYRDGTAMDYWTPAYRGCLYR